jgi:serine-type D-Ala-D-Ala carboxypeptidase/endopeptidase (penicillin-binding protein 4)
MFKLLPTFACVITTSLLLFLSACSISKSGFGKSKKLQKEIQQSAVFSKGFTGFTLIDPSTGQTLADVSGDHYFTPASNTKILTLYTTLKTLKDSVPGLQVHRLSDGTLLCRGTGDPSFLNPLFNHWQTIYTFLKRNEPMQYVSRVMPAERLGPGWSWDDTNDAYSAERSDWPIYGGLLEIYNADTKAKRRVWPPFFEEMMLDQQQLDSLPMHSADLYEHHYQVWPAALKPDTLHQPIHFARMFTPMLLADTLDIPLGDLQRPPYIPANQWKTINSVPLDTVLRRLMYESDNFVAEQLLLLCAGWRFDTLDPEKMIQFMQEGPLKSLPQPLKWVDGSGLSRYNLMTPRSIAQVLLMIWNEHDHRRVLSLFPAGGIHGTVASWYKGKNGTPYIFAKTGTLGAVHCLSGYINTKSGKTLIFSFMHNHFMGSSRPWKVEMQRLLELIHDQY